MKIIHIIEASATGTLSMASLLANLQSKDGSSVEVIYSTRDDTPRDFPQLFEQKIKLTQIQMFTSIEKIKSIFYIREILINENPKVVIMHSSFAGFLGRLASVFILKDSKFFYIPHCISFMRKDINLIKKCLFIIFEWIGSIKNATFIACSKSEQIEIKKYVPFRECMVIENAVSNILSEDRKEGNEIEIVTVGRISPQKNPKDFLKISALVKKEFPSVKFIWIGDGDEREKRILQSNNIEVTGWLSKSEVIKKLLSATLYLSSAKWEGMPVSLIEAIYAKLPIVASNCAGNIDVINPNQTGWIYRNNEEAAKIILLAVRDNTVAKKRALNAYNEATLRYNEDRYFSEFKNLINTNT
tara:strand:+ start:467 stop:1537 length:1071 start_codon:yes stop_codon:yes gene_type:complete